MFINRVAGVLLFLSVGFMNAETTIAGFKKSDLEQVLGLTGVTYDGTIVGLVEATQAAWLRPEGIERWELQKKHEDKREQLLPLFRKMWLVEEWINQRFTYKHIVFMGSEIGPEIEERLIRLCKLLAIPIHSDSLVFLSSERLLADHEIEFLRSKEFYDSSLTEWQALEYLCKKAKVFHENTVWVHVPYAPQSKKSFPRPATADTVIRWLEKRPLPQPGMVLVVSCQPFCNYQQLVVESLVPKGFVIKTVGAKADPQTPISEYLDTIARTLHHWHHAGSSL